MADPRPEVPPEVALRRLTAMARDAGAVARTDAALARGRARLIEEVERAAPPRAPWRRRWLVPAALAPLLVIAGLWVLRPAARLEVRIDGAAPADSYVRAGEGGATARFSEGTTVRFAPGARGRVAAITARGAAIHIERGAAHFEVVHLPGAEWIAEAGPFTVAVTGTEFDLSWQDERLELTMQSGSVAVRGPLAAGGIGLRGGQRLVADVVRGELTIADQKAAAEPHAPEGGDPREPGAAAGREAAADAGATAEASGAAGSDERGGRGEEGGREEKSGREEKGAPAAAERGAPAPEAAPSAVPDRAAAPQSYRERVARGDFARAIADAESRGIDAVIAASPLSELAALADAARYAGRNDLAERVLLAERSRFAGSPEARSAAFLLGRMAEPGSPAAAIVWYDRYLAESPAGSLAAEALGRKMMVVRASRGEAAARPIAEDYLARYPRGAFAATAAEILGRP
ncbi:FecR domain-containing protein [Sorangium sp. So ce131]|uniref:FecR domain-containing protein n=1 Tax=Sorangium sp. So ce131 TaxID=3133282 RepID=UPI003F6208A0